MIDQHLVDDVVELALGFDLAFSTTTGQKRHVPIVLTPAPIERDVFSSLRDSACLFGRLTQALADDVELIHALHAPLAMGDPFFAELLSIHTQLHGEQSSLPRVPLLLQRSDFMLDPQLGPRLVECNSIAAGMAPFGEQAHHLHNYVRRHWPQETTPYSSNTNTTGVPNPAILNMSRALSLAAERIRVEHNDGGSPTFLMVVQENEDNVFDQHLLERALQERGVRTFKRTFRELHAQLSSGSNDRLLLKGCGAIDVVYLRAGYQYRDYLALDLDSKRCCDALRATRIFIERHRVAVNATVSQQLATSKRTQQYLSEASVESLCDTGLSSKEVLSIKGVLAQMRSVNSRSVQWLRDEGELGNWVLKNQGEGGGHCLFDEQILPQLEGLPEANYAAWTLMRRLRPVERKTPTVMIRGGKGDMISGLVSELGMFTAHYKSEPLCHSGAADSAYLGYLVRSKGPDVTEGGIHSGFGALDSLVFT